MSEHSLLWELLDKMEQELRKNASYLKQINHFSSHYQGEVYARLYGWIAEAKALAMQDESFLPPEQPSEPDSSSSGGQEGGGR